MGSLGQWKGRGRRVATRNSVGLRATCERGAECWVVVGLALSVAHGGNRSWAARLGWHWVEEGRGKAGPLLAAGLARSDWAVGGRP